jgi:uncharacterized protein (TIGR02646 family)
MGQMISIKRGECPAVLADAKSDRNAYGDPTVIEALSNMQHGKCCYCEKSVGKSGNDRAVEHFRPQGNDAFLELRNTWSNLLHACSACNGKKWKHFPVDADGTPLLSDPSDPAIDDDDINFGHIQRLRSSFHALQGWEYDSLAVVTELALACINAAASVVSFPLQNAKGHPAAAEVMELRPLRAHLTATQGELILAEAEHFFNVGTEARQPTHFSSR